MRFKRHSRVLRLALALTVAAAVAGTVPALAQAGPSPSGPTAIALSSSVQLAWQPVAGASTYTVYRGTSPTTVNTAVTPVGGVAATGFTDYDGGERHDLLLRGQVDRRRHRVGELARGGGNAGSSHMFVEQRRRAGELLPGQHGLEQPQHSPNAGGNRGLRDRAKHQCRRVDRPQDQLRLRLQHRHLSQRLLRRHTGACLLDHPERSGHGAAGLRERRRAPACSTVETGRPRRR